MLAEATFNGRIVGLAASGKMLRLAQEKCRPYGNRASFVQQAADKLPFSNNQFDLVTCLESLEFFPSDTAALREMIRVLQPGSTLLVTRRKGREGKAFLGRYRTVYLNGQLSSHASQSHIRFFSVGAVFGRRLAIGQLRKK